MHEPLLNWLQSLDWLRSLVAVHYAGILMSLVAVMISDMLALNLLMRTGSAPPRWLIHTLHVAVAVGLCLLWLSGTAIAITKFSV
ncbi:MAG: hypothetical protein RLZ98_2420, partial [Pseudomonadota bacterium]